MFSATRAYVWFHRARTELLAFLTHSGERSALVDDTAEKAASVSSEGDDPHKGALGDLASVKEDVKRLEGEVDKLLDLILRIAFGGRGC